MKKAPLTLQLAHETRRALKVLAAQQQISVQKLLEPAIDQVIVNALECQGLPDEQQPRES